MGKTIKTIIHIPAAPLTSYHVCLFLTIAVSAPDLWVFTRFHPRCLCSKSLGIALSLSLSNICSRRPPVSLFVRDGKFPKSLSAALDPAAAGDVPAAASSVFVGAAARAAAAAAQVTSKKATSSKKGLMASPSGKGKAPGSVSRSNHRPRRAGAEEEEERAGEGEGEDEEEASIMALLPPR